MVVNKWQLGSNDRFYSRTTYKHCLAKEKSGEGLFIIYSTHYIDEDFYVKEIMMLTISVKKFLNVLCNV
jgi:hypothetical protein